jgi:hypothetical protein
MPKKFHYYKIQCGGKTLVLVNKVVIVFIMEIVHDDNKLNSGQIGQVVAMGGSEKTQDLFLCYYTMLIIINYNLTLSMGNWKFQSTSIFILFTFLILCWKARLLSPW